MTEKNILYKILTSLTSIGLAVAGWFLTQTMSQIQDLERRIYTVEITEAKNSSGKFTTNDWAIAKALIDNDKMAFDRRIIKLEESIPVIRESLIDIKQSIKDIK